MQKAAQTHHVCVRLCGFNITMSVSVHTFWNRDFASSNSVSCLQNRFSPFNFLSHNHTFEIHTQKKAYIVCILVRTDASRIHAILVCCLPTSQWISLSSSKQASILSVSRCDQACHNSSGGDVNRYINGVFNDIKQTRHVLASSNPNRNSRRAVCDIEAVDPNMIGGPVDSKDHQRVAGL